VQTQQKHVRKISENTPEKSKQQTNQMFEKLSENNSEKSCPRQKGVLNLKTAP
jgi:hypothetical protein